jgi:hypothetical protein
MVEASRKHGPFDTRWSCAGKRGSEAAATAPPLSDAEAAEALDWNGFSNRYFRLRPRHDAEARSAYAAYKQGREWRTPPARLRLIPTEHVSAPADPPEEADPTPTGGDRRSTTNPAPRLPRMIVEKFDKRGEIARPLNPRNTIG